MTAAARGTSEEQFRKSSSPALLAASSLDCFLTRPTIRSYSKGSLFTGALADSSYKLLHLANYLSSFNNCYAQDCAVRPMPLPQFLCKTRHNPLCPHRAESKTKNKKNNHKGIITLHLKERYAADKWSPKRGVQEASPLHLQAVSIKKQLPASVTKEHISQNLTSVMAPIILSQHPQSDHRLNKDGDLCGRQFSSGPQSKSSSWSSFETGLGPSELPGIDKV